jgi:hypothetical protein
MPFIVVGGQTKDIGKTTLVCNIIAAFADCSWTAMKLTTHAHKPLHCELLNQPEGRSIWRETSRGDDSDTARFLEAGAKEAYLIESPVERLSSACDWLLSRQGRQGHVIVESSSAAEFLSPDLFLILIHAGAANFKKSAIDQLSRADVFVRRGNEAELSIGISQPVKGKPVFEARLRGLDPGLHSLISSVLKCSG